MIEESPMNEAGPIDIPTMASNDLACSCHPNPKLIRRAMRNVIVIPNEIRKISEKCSIPPS